MTSLWCRSKNPSPRNSPPLQPPPVEHTNLFDKFEGMTSTAPQYATTTLVTHCEINFNKRNKDCIIIVYNGAEFTFELMKAEEEEKIGTLVCRSRYVTDYHYDPKQNGIGAIIQRLKEINKFRNIDRIEFNDPHRSIHQLRVFPETFQAKEIEISKERASTVELDFIKQNFTLIRRLTIFAALPGGYRLWPLQFLQVNMQDGRGVTFGDIQNMKCQKLEIHYSSLVTNRLNEILMHWIIGVRYRQIQSLIIRNVTHRLNLFNGIQHIETSIKHHGRYFVQDRDVIFDCIGGKDIQRADGTWATIIYEGNVFRMYVWHQTYHIVAEGDPRIISIGTEKALGNNQ